MRTFPPGLDPVVDLSPSLWVQEALKDWPRERFRVRDLVPPVFEAYARILHRPRRPDDLKDPTGTWAQRAATLGREMGPETTWWALLGTAPYEGGMDHGPDEGRLNESEVATLASFLGADTADPSACWFALWSGFGIFSTGSSFLRAGGTLAQRLGKLRVRRAERRANRRAERARARLATFRLLGQSGRSYILMRGAVSDAIRFSFDGWFQSPTLWWPDDRSWFVHTEIDGTSTYVGGSRPMVGRLVGEQILESFEVGADTPAAL
jgi:hypothetical protein